MALNHKQMTELRDRVLTIIAEHETNEHASDVCMDERCNVIAWLCHCVGVESLEALTQVTVILGDYKRRHDHAHLDNPAATFTQ